MASKKTWLGIDFSGDHLKWRPGCTKSNVWIATVQDADPRPELTSLVQVQELSKTFGKPPLESLVDRLQKNDFDAAGIDAPFSVPKQFIKDLDYFSFLTKVGKILHPNRPFPRGISFVEEITGKTPPLEKDPKPLRMIDEEWSKQKVNVRSPMWDGQKARRTGAPMTAACMTLLAQRDKPIWPWDDRNNKKLLVEAFPAAQLQKWNLPYEKYNGSSPEARLAREKIVGDLRNRADFIVGEDKMLSSADALDAVICTFAAQAVTEGQLDSEREQWKEFWKLEGWIAVHK